MWVTKYRRRVITEAIGTRLADLFSEIAQPHNVRILEFNWEADHVHLLVSASPCLHIPAFIQSMKGVSSRVLFLEFPEIRRKLWGGHLWSPSYFIATVSENTEAQIQRYIQNQRRE